MLKSCGSGGSRCARRALMLVFAWGLLMIAAVHLRNAEVLSRGVPSVRGSEEPKDQPIPQLGFSRFLLQRQEGMSTIKSPLVEPRIDRSPAKSEAEVIQEIENNLPSLPIAHWNKNSKLNQQTKSANGCTIKYPNVFDIEYNNFYWQTLVSSNGTFQLFGAFYDIRKLSRIGPAVRIVGMINRIEPVVKSFCQIWFDGDSQPAVVDVLEYKYIWYSKWGNHKTGIYQPYLIACKIPQTHWKKGPPVSVSLVEKGCDAATNNLRVIYNKPQKKKEFAVCVKGLDFLHEDLSVRLVEWIELIGQFSKFQHSIVSQTN